MNNATIDLLSNLYMEAKAHELELNGKCNDCGKPVQVVVYVDFDTNQFTLSDTGIVHVPAQIDKPLFKCKECWQRSPVFHDFQPVEKFTRVCGYLRPVKQFNPGKKAEFEMRTNYAVKAV